MKTVATPRRTLLLRLLCAALLALAGVQAQAEPPPLIARVADWPPASWQEDGVWQGMNIDFYTALAKESGLTFAYRNLPWSRALHGLKTGDCSIMAEVSKTEERAAAMHFLGPYAHEEMVLVVRKEDLAVPVDNLQMLLTQSRARGLLIGIERDAYYGPEFSLRLEKDPAFRASFEVARTTLEKMINNGRLFAFIEQRHIAAQRIRDNPDYANLAIHPFTVNRDPLYMAVSKTVAPEIVARLERAMGKLASDGTFAAIEARWTGQ